MENWDEKKLEDVVNKKHAEAESKKAKTDIICKHFLTAIENKKYGWFWECPIGDKCIYRHALPPGFVLKQDSAKEDKKDEISIEELVEKERASLGAKTTKITLETFMAWKQRKLKEKKEKLEAEQSKKKANFTTGKLFGISGREMFTFNPEMADEDDAEADEILDRESESEDEEVVTSSMREWTAESVANVAMEADGSGTASTSNARVGNPTNHTGEGDITKSSEASALPAVFDGTCNVDGGTAENGETVPINEDLFDPDDLDDLDELEDDIGDLDMADQ